MSTTPIENIVGAASGRPNLIVWVGSDYDMDAVGSAITSDNTLAVDRWNTSTGARERYVPGAVGNPFHTLDAGYGSAHGRAYLIHAKASFRLDGCAPGSPVEEVS